MTCMFGTYFAFPLQACEGCSEVAAEWQEDNFNEPLELANTSCAFVSGGQSRARLFAALERAGERRLDDFDGQELFNTAWE